MESIQSHKRTLNKVLLIKSSLIKERKIVLKKQIDSFLRGEYSTMSNNQGVLWEGTINTNTELIVSYSAEKKSTHFNLFFFSSNQHLNFKIATNLTLSEQILHHQHNLGSLLWASNVGIDLMVPAGTNVKFQLIIVSKLELIEYIKKQDILINEPLLSFTKSCVPLFYFSKVRVHFNNNILKKDADNEEKAGYGLRILTQYLCLNYTISNTGFTLWDFYAVLAMEEQICKTPIINKQNVEGLNMVLNCHYNTISKLFKQVFDFSIFEYHKHHYPLNTKYNLNR
jgi:hypothetical protein